MRLFLVFAVLLAGRSLYGLESPKMILVIEQSGVAYVSASELEREWRVAVKTLPGHDVLAVCSGQRCALVKDFVRKDKEIWVSTPALEKALGWKSRFSHDRRSVSFAFESPEVSTTDSPARVGQLAPNFQVARLDGSLVSLADFRGKRVLINSWASW